MRTSVATKRRELGKHLDSLNANTHLVDETGPPDNDKNPDFINYWDISVLIAP